MERMEEYKEIENMIEKLRTMRNEKYDWNTSEESSHIRHHYNSAIDRLDVLSSKILNQKENK